VDYCRRGPEFRRDYDKIGNLRAIFPAARFMALTATATIGAQQEISNKLLMTVCIVY
jgi:superfamily II DNA helicase RecQ